jgi:hypothetical protein
VTALAESWADLFCEGCGFDLCLCAETSLANFVPPRYSISQVNKAGRAYVKPPPRLANGERDEAAFERWARACDVVDNWRAAHAYPLGQFRDWLRRHAVTVHSKALVAQRLKRSESLDRKLFEGSRLSKVQDIAGCRAVVSNTQQVAAIVQRLRSAHVKHDLVDDADDYIAKPKSSGYRSTHLVFAYNSTAKAAYNGLRCEIQVRTEDQHAWATAVEVAGFFLGQNLKASKGQMSWLRFFQVAGAVIAHKEGGQMIPGTSSNRAEVVQELKQLAHDLNVWDWMRGFHLAPTAVTQDKPKGRAKVFWYLVEICISKKRVRWWTYSLAQTADANKAYADAERAAADDADTSVVLVSADGMKSLKAAYASFFGDTAGFSKLIRPLIDHA